MDKINSKNSIGYADYLKIIFADKCIDVFLEDERCLDYTFDEVIQEAKQKGWEDGTILLIAESPLAGKIYQYGNYGSYWVEHGTTSGYA